MPFTRRTTLASVALTTKLPYVHQHGLISQINPTRHQSLDICEHGAKEPHKIPHLPDQLFRKDKTGNAPAHTAHTHPRGSGATAFTHPCGSGATAFSHPCGSGAAAFTYPCGSVWGDKREAPSLRDDVCWSAPFSEPPQPLFPLQGSFFIFPVADILFFPLPGAGIEDDKFYSNRRQVSDNLWAPAVKKYFCALTGIRHRMDQ